MPAPGRNPVLQRTVPAGRMYWAVALLLTAIGIRLDVSGDLWITADDRFEDAVLRNAFLMHQKLEGVTSARAAKMRALLESILARAPC